MAVNNWINYAGLPAQKSPLADLFENVLQGYRMQREPKKIGQEEKLRELMNQIKGSEAKYADPLNEARIALMSNQIEGSRASTQKLLMEAAQEQAFMDALRGAPSNVGGMVREGNGSGYIGSEPAGSGSNYYSNSKDNSGISDPNIYGGGDVSESDKGLNPNGFNIEEQDSPIQSNPRFKNNIPDLTKLNLGADGSNIIEKGSPDLYHIDRIYEEHPEFRDKLEKKGFTKKQVVKFDPKTGTSSIITTYPSKKVEMKVIKGSGSDKQPLTNSEVTKNQDIIRGIDNSLPSLGKLLELKHPSRGIGFLGNPSDKAAYHALTAGVIDSLVSSLGLPKVQESINLVKHMVEKGTFENDESYNKRIENLIEDLQSRRDYSSKALTKGVASSANAPSMPSAIKNKKQFQDWLKKLTPYERYLVKKEHIGDER